MAGMPRRNQYFQGVSEETIFQMETPQLITILMGLLSDTQAGTIKLQEAERILEILNKVRHKWHSLPATNNRIVKIDSSTLQSLL